MGSYIPDTWWLKDKDPKFPDEPQTSYILEMQITGFKIKQLLVHFY